MNSLNNNFNLFLIIICVCGQNKDVNGKSVPLKFTATKIYCNQHYLLCTYNFTNNGTTMNFNMTLIRQIEGNLRLNFMFKRKIGKKYASIVKTENRNFCKFVEDIVRDSIVGPVVGPPLKEIGITKCPILKGSYLLKNFNITTDLLPLFLPKGEFRIIADIYQPQQDNVKIITSINNFAFF